MALITWYPASGWLSKYSLNLSPSTAQTLVGSIAVMVPECLWGEQLRKNRLPGLGSHKLLWHFWVLSACQVGFFFR